MLIFVIVVIIIVVVSIVIYTQKNPRKDCSRCEHCNQTYTQSIHGAWEFYCGLNYNSERAAKEADDIRADPEYKVCDKFSRR